MKEQDAGLLKILGPLAGDALRLSGYDKGGVSVALNPVDSKIYEVKMSTPRHVNAFPGSVEHHHELMYRVSTKTHTRKFVLNILSKNKIKY